MTDKALYDINFFGGLGLEAETLANKKLAAASNVIYELQGGLTRRYGTATIHNFLGTQSLVDLQNLEPTKNLNDPSTNSPSIETTKLIGSYRNSLFRMGESKLYSDAFNYVDLLPNAVATYDVISSATSSLVACDSVECQVAQFYYCKVVLYREDTVDSSLAVYDGYHYFYIDVYANGALIHSKIPVNPNGAGKSTKAQLVRTFDNVIVVYDDPETPNFLCYRVLKLTYPEVGFSSYNFITAKYNYDLTTNTYSIGTPYVSKGGLFNRVVFDATAYSLDQDYGNTFLISYVVQVTTDGVDYWYPEVQRVTFKSTYPGGLPAFPIDNTNSVLLWAGGGKSSYTYRIDRISLTSDTTASGGSPYVWLTYGGVFGNSNSKAFSVPLIKSGSVSTNPRGYTTEIPISNDHGTNAFGTIQQLVSVNCAAAYVDPTDPSYPGHVAYVGINFLHLQSININITGGGWGTVAKQRKLLTTHRLDVYSQVVSGETRISAHITAHHFTWDCFAQFLSRPWIYNGVPYAAANIGRESDDGSINYSHVVLDFMLGPQRMKWGHYAPSRVRPVCNVLPRQVSYLDQNTTRLNSWQIDYPISNTTVVGSTVKYVGAVSNSGSNTSGICSVAQFTVNHVFNRSTTQGNGSLLIAGGVPCKYDGATISEMGYIRPPAIIGGYPTNSIGGEPETGKHYYKVVYEWIDNNGLVSKSESSDMFSITKTAYKNELAIGYNLLTLRHIQDKYSYNGLNPIKIAVYRSTLDSDANFYRVTTLPINRTFDNVPSFASANYPPTLKFHDNVTDATLVNNELLYEADGAILGNVSPPSASIVCTHKSRFWLAGTPDDSIWYSKTFVSLQEPGFNEVLTISPFEGGRITGLASLDDYLVVFKENSVWIIQGDGHDASGTGSTLQPPVRIVEGTGCTTPDSIVVAKDSVFFQSNDGIYRLRRGTNQLECISNGIRPFTTSYYKRFNLRIQGVVHVQRDNTLRFAFYGTYTNIVNGNPVPSSSKLFAVYNLDFEAWTTFTYSKYDSYTWPLERTVIKQCVHNGEWYGCDLDNIIIKETVDNKTDDDGQMPINCTVMSGYIAIENVAGFDRFQRLLVTGQRTGTSVGNVSATFVSRSPTKSTSVTRYLQSTSNGFEFLEFPIFYQKTNAMYVSVTWTPNLKTALGYDWPIPDGDGDNLRITGITLYGHPMRGKARKATSISRKSSV